VLAGVLEGGLDLARHLIVGIAAERNATRLGKRLQTRRDVDAVAIDVVAFDDNVAQVDADSKDDALVFVGRRVALGHALLHRDRTGDSVDDAWELDQGAVTHQLDDPPAVPGDQGIDEFGAVRLKRGKRARLIFFHEARVTDHIGGKYGSQASPHARSPLFSSLTRASEGIYDVCRTLRSLPVGTRFIPPVVPPCAGPRSYGSTPLRPGRAATFERSRPTPWARS